MKNLKTKLSYTLCILLVAFLMVGCSDNNKRQYYEPEAMSEYKIVEVEGCEYILFYGNDDELRYDGVTHKGNCKNH
jgi:hypothetical protein